MRSEVVVTKVTPAELAQLKALCIRRSLEEGQRVTLNDLVYNLVKQELREALAKGEISDFKEVRPR